MQPNNLVVEIDKIFTELKRKNYTTQIEAAKNLQSFMISHIDQSDEVFFRLQELSKSNEKHEIVGFFHAINRYGFAFYSVLLPCTNFFIIRRIYLCLIK